jgi:hypothetical protein
MLRVACMSRIIAGMDTAASSSTSRPAEVSTADSSAVVALSSRQRSCVTNGKRLLAGIDGRSAEARRYKDVAMSLADDLGGAAGLTESQRALVKQAASLTVQSETMAAAMIRGEAIDVEQQTRVANSLSRTVHRLGRTKAKPREQSFLTRLAEGAR